MRAETQDFLLERALALARQGRLDGAITQIEKLASTPDITRHRIALYMQRSLESDLLKATELLVQQQDLLPHSAEPYLQLADIQWRSGHDSDALELVISAFETEPSHPQIDYYLGVAMQKTGRFQSALEAYRETVAKNSRQPLSELEMDIEVAIQAYETAAGHYPGSRVEDEAQLVNAEQEYDTLRAALTHWHASGPDLSALGEDQVVRYGNAFYNLGCSDMARYDRAKRAGDHFKACLAVNPNHLQARCNHLFLLNYDHKISEDEIIQAHFTAAREIRAQVGPPLAKFGNNRNTGRMLRIGYLSSDFRKHSVIYFILPVLAAHDRSQFQVHAYYNERKLDNLTREVRSMVDVMHPVALMKDNELQQKIINDGIDILIDLNGYTKGHRAGLLMHRAAPVQVNWLGYPNTTGMDVMDYRIVDGCTDPEGTDDTCSETLIRMPEVFSVYLPEPALPPVSAQTPALENGFVTFGSFNNLPKLNPELLGMWSEILAAVPGSRLLIKNIGLSQPVIVRDLEQALTEAGIDLSRVTLAGRSREITAHMAFYNSVDLCLDSYPYNGTTTTCDSLFMGVPVLTIAGNSHRSRVTASQLQAIGLHRQLVAEDSTEYVKIAIRLASDHVMLNNLRQGLRVRLQQSPLMDAKTFTRELENQYHKMWDKWCAKENYGQERS